MEVGKLFYKDTDGGDIIQVTLFHDGTVDVTANSKMQWVKHLFAYMKTILFSSKKVNQNSFDERLKEDIQPLMQNYKNYCRNNNIEFMIPEEGKESRPDYIQ